MTKQDSLARQKSNKRFFLIRDLVPFVLDEKTSGRTFSPLIKAAPLLIMTEIFVSFFSACKFDLTLQACTRADKKSYCRCRAVTSMKRAEAKIVNFLFTCERKI